MPNGPGFLNKIVGLKYFNVFGPNEDHKGDMRSLVHKSFAQVQNESVIRLFKSYRKDYKDGEQKRDFLYVKDAVAMTLHLAAHAKAERAFQYWQRRGADMDGSGQRGFCRAEKETEHRIHRDAGNDPRQVPVFHAGEPVRACAAPVTPRQ